MSTPISTDGIAARIRLLRGEESQAAFSQKVGLTRAALANYETGRTTPKRSVLRRICQRLGISESALIQGEAQDMTDLLGSLGIYDEVATLPGLTDDEKAIIRVLRICDTEVVHSVVSSMTAGLEQKKFWSNGADPGTIVEDIARLYQIAKAGGAYLRGVTPDALSAISAFIESKKAEK